MNKKPIPKKQPHKNKKSKRKVTPDYISHCVIKYHEPKK